jgi:hypothetical protein
MVLCSPEEVNMVSEIVDYASDWTEQPAASL